MAQHDFTPAWLSFPADPSPAKSYHKSLECATDRLDHQVNVNLRRHNSSDGAEAVSGRTGGGYSRSEKNGWKVRNNSEGSASRPAAQHGGAVLRSKTKGLQECGDGDRRKNFGAEDFPSLNPDAERELNQNKAVTAGVWEHPPNPQSRSSKMTVIKRVSREESSSASTKQQVPARNGTGPYSHKAPITKSASLPVKASRSSSSSPVDQGGPPRLMMRLSRMRSDKKSHFLKALRQDMVGEEDLHLHCKGEDVFNLQNNHLSQLSGGDGDGNCNGYEGSRGPQENGNPISLTSRQQGLCSSALHQQEAQLSSSLEAEHRLLREMGWQEESENDETCAPLTEDEMREFQAISEQLQRNGLRKNGRLKSALSSDRMAVWKDNNLHVAVKPATEETETSSSDTSDDEA